MALKTNSVFVLSNWIDIKARLSSGFYILKFFAGDEESGAVLQVVEVDVGTF